MTAAVSELLTWLTGGSALAALIKVLFAVCALVLGLLYRRYVGVLGADRRRPVERQAYDALRDSLAGAILRPGYMRGGSPVSWMALTVFSVMLAGAIGHYFRTIWVEKARGAVDRAPF